MGSLSDQPRPMTAEERDFVEWERNLEHARRHDWHVRFMVEGETLRAVEADRRIARAECARRGPLVALVREWTEWVLDPMTFNVNEKMRDYAERAAALAAITEHADAE